MKFIELTLTATKQKVFLNPNTIESFVWQGDFTGIGLSYTATMSVEETPETIMQLINGNQKELGWIENKLGEMPCDPNEIVAVVIEDEYEAGRACNFNWKLPPALVGYPITHYKIIGACPE